VPIELARQITQRLRIPTIGIGAGPHTDGQIMVMHDLLGITPPDDRRGCLQDIHWYSGSWGYFPTYTLGALAAAQIFDTAIKADGAILPSLARGDFVPLMTWLRQHIHRHGSRLSTDALLAEATGRPLDAAAFKRHLRRRYLGQ